MTNLQLLTLQYALSFLGLPYIYGGNSALNGFDCSGLVVEILKSDGKFPNNSDASSASLWKYLKNIGWGETLKHDFGNLYFYGTKSKINHVAYGIGDGKIIEAAGGDSTTTTRAKAAAKDANVRLRMFNYRADLVGILSEGSNLINITSRK